MRLLIGGSPSKYFHLKEFGESLTNFGSEYKLVLDTEIIDGFPSKKIQNWFQTRKKFNKIIDDFKPDAIFVDRQTHFGIAAIKTGLPLFVHLRGDYWSEFKWARETLYKGMIMRTVLNEKNKIAERCFRESSCILPICNYLNNIVSSHYPNKRVTTLYQGIDPDKWFKSDGMNLKHPCVGLLQSANIWGKTKEMLTLENVIKSLPNVTFYWAGDGPYKKEVLSSLDKFENFIWLGQLEYPNVVRQFLSEIDIYALISGIDMSPLTLQEAQLMEKPVLATNVGGIPELTKDQDTGYLVEKGDSQNIIDKILMLLDSPSKSKKMGINGRNYVKQNFSWEIITKNFLESTSTIIN